MKIKDKVKIKIYDESEFLRDNYSDSGTPFIFMGDKKIAEKISSEDNYTKRILRIVHGTR